MRENQKRIVQNYIQAYNAMDAEGMLKDLAGDLVFENISGAKVTLRTEGIEAFRKQAEMAVSYFSHRKQTILSWKFEKEKVVAEIEYEGILAMDLPNGMKSGEVLQMKGYSEFYFKEGKIITIKDIS